MKHSSATSQRCYLAGPMRGIPEYNFPAFHAAAAKLRAHGLNVWSPAENDVNQDGFDPAKDAAQPMRHYMKRDLPAVLDADMVCVLPGWEKSQGAQLEVHVARTCGIPVYNAHGLTPVYALSEIAMPKIESSADDVRAALVYLHDSTKPDGQWADQAVHGFVGAMLKSSITARSARVEPGYLDNLEQSLAERGALVRVPQAPGDDKPQGPDRRESIVATVGDDAILYLQLMNFEDGERVEVMVTPANARSSVAENDLGDLTQACVEEFEKSLGRNLPGRQTAIIRKHIEKVFSLRSARGENEVTGALVSNGLTKGNAVAIAPELLAHAKQWAALTFNPEDCPPGSKMVNTACIDFAKELVRLSRYVPGGSDGKK